MKKTLISTTLASLVLSGCATYPLSTFQPFQTTDLNPLVEKGALQQKTDTFYVINDSSSSMSEVYSGEGFPGQSEPTKFSVERELLARMNKSIPNIVLSSGVRSFGYGSCVDWGFTQLNQSVQSYSSKSFDKSLETLECSSGGTPIDRAFEAATADLSSAPGNIAVILLSDGTGFDGFPSPAVQALKDQYGDKLCLSTIWVGNEGDADGQAVLKELSEISGCGYSVTASELAVTKGMEAFVKNVFFNEMNVSTDGDSDGDGVPDSKDKCPDTPKGAVVDRDGCWSFRGVHFDFDKSNIKPSSAPIFKESIKVLKKNPNITVEIQGHTDSVGPKSYNQGLSVRRAKSVKNHLIDNGVSSSRLSTKGFGESQPSSSNATNEGRADNRRVVYKVLSK
jgi:OOP family OmpA-OmpF porin